MRFDAFSLYVVGTGERASERERVCVRESEGVGASENAEVAEGCEETVLSP